MLREHWYVLGTEAKKLYVREWLPQENTPQKGIVLIVHGHGEHGERYSVVAEQLTEAGYVTVAYDLQGHGHSDGKRGHMRAMHAAIEDLMLVMEEARERHSNIPVTLYGHSMGGNISLNCAIKRKPNIQGLVLTSPWLKLAFKPPVIKEWFGKAIARIMPSLPLSTGLRADDLFRPSKQGATPIKEDPLYHTIITPRTYLEVQQAGEWALKYGKELHVPVLLMHGDADRITSCDASKELARALNMRCEWHEIKGGLHELHNDTEGEQTVNNIVAWIDRQHSLITL